MQEIEHQNTGEAIFFRNSKRYSAVLALVDNRDSTQEAASSLLRSGILLTDSLAISSIVCLCPAISAIPEVHKSLDEP